jgi:Icc-related predicted phosphoesterase
VRLLAFSDLHRDLGQAGELVERSAQADVVVGAGDFASIHNGLEETIDALAAIACPAVLVPGNNETEAELRSASEGWPSATVLHGEGTEIDGVAFFGLGAGVPVTPWDWSFDLTEEEATGMLSPLAPDAVLISHSPPLGHCDRNSSGKSLGSRAVLEAAERKQPKLVLCGHIHESWGAESEIGPARVFNLGPAGRLLEI